MTALTAHRRLPAAPLWVSIEGINGVGKTSAARATAAHLGARCVLLDELTDTSEVALHEQVIAALTVPGDPFLRTGQPAVAQAAQGHAPSVDPADPVAVFAALRQWKNEFR